jgi:hypothetical protein
MTNPDLANGWIQVIPLSGKGIERRFGLLERSGLVNGFEVNITATAPPKM